MNAHKRKQALLAVDISLALGVLAAIIPALWPIEEPSQPSSRVRPAATTEPVASRSIGPLSDYSMASNMQLRRPLEDPKPVAARPPAKPKPAFTLIGTAPEDDGGYAILRGPDQQVRFLNLGETLEGMRLLVVKDDYIAVQFNGEKIDLHREKEDPR